MVLFLKKMSLDNLYILASVDKFLNCPEYYKSLNDKTGEPGIV